MHMTVCGFLLLHVGSINQVSPKRMGETDRRRNDIVMCLLQQVSQSEDPPNRWWPWISATTSSVRGSRASGSGDQTRRGSKVQDVVLSYLPVLATVRTCIGSSRWSRRFSNIQDGWIHAVVMRGGKCERRVRQVSPTYQSTSTWM